LKQECRLLSCDKTKVGADTQEGKPIADGDSTHVAPGDRVSRMQFRFKDSSIYVPFTAKLL